MRKSSVAVLYLAFLASGCAERPGPDAPSEASVPSFTRAAGATSAPAAPPAVATSAAAPAPVSSDEPAEPEPGSTAEAAASASAPPAEEPLPAVDITNYGMHIGGGPNDNATKAPIREAVRAQNDAFRACYRLVSGGKKEVIFRVELLIPGPGGKADVTLPDNARKSDAFAECMLSAFGDVDFKRPPHGQPQRVAYSLRFESKGKSSAKDADAG